MILFLIDKANNINPNTTFGIWYPVSNFLETLEESWEGKTGRPDLVSKLCTPYNEIVDGWMKNLEGKYYSKEALLSYNILNLGIIDHTLKNTSQTFTLMDWSKTLFIHLYGCNVTHCCSSTKNLAKSCLFLVPWLLYRYCQTLTIVYSWIREPRTSQVWSLSSTYAKSINICNISKC